MPKQVMLAFMVEFFMILMTTVLLLQPRSIFGAITPRMSSAAMGSGLILLCLTFCWSVIFGAVLALNQMTLRI
jgi:hypothetical protein